MAMSSWSVRAVIDVLQRAEVFLLFAVQSFGVETHGALPGIFQFRLTDGLYLGDGEPCRLLPALQQYAVQHRALSLIGLERRQIPHVVPPRTLLLELAQLVRDAFHDVGHVARIGDDIELDEQADLHTAATGHRPVPFLLYGQKRQVSTFGFGRNTVSLNILSISRSNFAMAFSSCCVVNWSHHRSSLSR